MKVTFLSAEMPLTKSYRRLEDGSIESTPYPLTSHFTSFEHEVRGIDDLLVQVLAHAELGHCLLKGNLIKSIQNESRAGLMAAEPTSFMCLDLDGMEVEGDSPDRVLELLGLDPGSYILQYSASYGIKRGLNAHLLVLLDRPTPTTHLKQWLKHKNLSVPELRGQLRLTRSHMALHWPLDITVCQADKLIYIAPPTLVGIEDTLGDRRIQLRVRHDGPAAVNIQDVPSTVDNDARALVQELREQAGLPPHQLQVRYYVKEGAELMGNPDVASVTGQRINRGFVYLNLNGGDSWGYFHPEGNPEVLYNFKGEPNYRTREIVPDYYREVTARQRLERAKAHTPNPEVQREQCFVINRRDDGSYYKVIYRPQERALELVPAPTLKHIADWCKLRGVPIPDAIADWDVEFDPTSAEIINVHERRLNLYRPTSYKLATLSNPDAQAVGDAAGDRKASLRLASLPGPESQAVGSAGGDAHTPDCTDAAARGNEEPDGAVEQRLLVPAQYGRLVRHVCGSDDEAAWRFLNWLAYIWQTGRKPGTAWVLHGTYGTGKGRFLKVLKELFGQQCVVTSPESISEHFNRQMEHAQILWIDEVTTDAWDNAKITPKLRNWITEETVVVRAMRRDGVARTNFMGIIVAANEHNPVEIRADDRRWNVAVRQELPLRTCAWATSELLDDETGWLYRSENLQELAMALARFPCNPVLVREPLANAAKVVVQQVTQSLPEDIVQALLSGDVGYFLEHYPEQGDSVTMEGIDYRKVIDRIFAYPGHKVSLVLRNTEVQHLFAFLAGWTQKSGKFAKAVSRFGLHISGKKARLDSETVVAGSRYTFDVSEEDRALWLRLNPKQPLRDASSM